MEIVGSVDMTIPLWGILIALASGAWFIIDMRSNMKLMEKDMSSKMQLMEKDMKAQNKELSEIKELLYKFIKPIEKTFK